MGWSFDDWARENGLTSSGARIDKSKSLCSEARINQEPQRKKRCVDVVSFLEDFVLFRFFLEINFLKAILKKQLSLFPVFLKSA